MEIKLPHPRNYHE